MYKRILVPLDGSTPGGEVFASRQESGELNTMTKFSLIPEGSIAGTVLAITHPVSLQKVRDSAANRKNYNCVSNSCFGGSQPPNQAN
jgi:hypothetical protein